VDCVAQALTEGNTMTDKSQTPDGLALFLTWDTFGITQHQAQFLVDTGEAADEDEGFRRACEDSDLITVEWEFMLAELTEKMRAINARGHWQGEVVNFGWNKRQGFTEFVADNGRDFLANILPKTDCTFHIYIENGCRFKIQNFHHDSPTGNEWYTLNPLIPALHEAAA
jgi:hypothetical protein